MAKIRLSDKDMEKVSGGVVHFPDGRRGEYPTPKADVNTEIIPNGIVKDTVKLIENK